LKSAGLDLPSHLLDGHAATHSIMAMGRHHRPCHPGEFVGERDGSDLVGSSRQQTQRGISNAWIEHRGLDHDRTWHRNLVHLTTTPANSAPNLSIHVAVMSRTISRALSKGR